MKRIVLASGNQGKVREFNALFANSGVEVVCQSDLNVPEVPETGMSFVENALLKARNAAMYSGLPALADDSGLVVKALNGDPGLYSARYADENANDTANNLKLLDKLSAIPATERQAAFRCCIVYLRAPDDPIPLIAEASWQGSILFAPQGEQGFGYDPLFYVPSHQCSAAQLDPAEKNRISHRGQAMQRLWELLAAELKE